MNPTQHVKSVMRMALLALTVLSMLVGAPPRAPAAADDLPPLTMYLTVRSPVDDAVEARITNAAVGLQNEARAQGRKALLVLEITPGTSPIGEVQDLMRFLTSSKLSAVKTVAWVPETVTGNNALLALAANEIIMHPDAQLGDIGRGEALDQTEQTFILSLLDKRQNVKVSSGLVKGMLDPAAQVVRIEVQTAGGGTESQVVTRQEHERRVNAGEVIPRSTTIKEAGAAGLFSGREARNGDFLVAHTAESRGEIESLYNLPPNSLREDPTAGVEPNVKLIKIEGPIDSVLESFIKRQIDRAVAGGANVIIFEIDSPGGELTASLSLANAIADLEEKDIRTVAWVGERKMALSGAAITALGADEIYMHPTALLGDAGVIQQGQDGLFDRAPEKIVSPVRQWMKELAERKGRPAALAMAMVDRNMEVYRVTHRDTGRVWYMTEDQLHAAGDEWVKGPMLPESREGLLLTVDGEKAAEYKLAEAPVESFGELKDRLGLPAGLTVQRLGETWVDQLIFELNRPRAMFLMAVVGFICLFVELHLMTGILGIISAICFALFFWSRFMGGTAGWLEVILFALGLICLVLEIFVIPGFGVFGISGGLLLLASLVLASQTWGHIEPYRDLELMTRTLGTLTMAVVSVVILAILMNRFLPHMPLLNQMILTPPGYAGDFDAAGPRLRPDLAASAASAPGRPMVGTRGTAVTALRPAGKAQIADEFLDVVSDGPYVPSGAAVEVVELSGNRITVREV